MSNAVRMCKIFLCQREAATLCYHCQQEICHTHFAEHSSSIMTDVYLLADRTNALTDDISALSIALTRDNLFEELQQWRDGSVSLIENVYTEKQLELNIKLEQIDKALNLKKNDKQHETLEVRKTISGLIEGGEASFDQLNRLRKSIDQISLDVDKLRTPPIRIEIRPANLDTCRIISKNKFSDTESEDESVSDSKVSSKNDVKHSKKPPVQLSFSTNQSTVTNGNGHSNASAPATDSLKAPYPLYVPVATPSLGAPLPPVPPPPPLHSFPVQPRMSVLHPSMYKSRETNSNQRSLMMPASYFTYELSPQVFTIPYPSAVSSSPRYRPPDFFYMKK